MVTMIKVVTVSFCLATYLHVCVCNRNIYDDGLRKFQSNKQGIQHVKGNTLMNIHGSDEAEKKLTAGIEIHVTFSAYLSHNSPDMTSDQTIVFDHVLVNDGNGYDPTTGIFTAPISGVYHFSYSIVATQYSHSTSILTVDGAVISSVVADTYQWQLGAQTSNSVTASVNRGQNVELRYHSGNGGVQSGVNTGLSTFSVEIEFGQVVCTLTVDGKVISSALADSYEAKNGLQTGNTVIAPVISGQSVKLTYHSGKGRILSGLFTGLSAFSGFLLYVS